MTPRAPVPSAGAADHRFFALLVPVGELLPADAQHFEHLVASMSYDMVT